MAERSEVATGVVLRSQRLRRTVLLEQFGRWWRVALVFAPLVQSANHLDGLGVDLEFAGGGGDRQRAIDVGREDGVEGVVRDPEFVLVGLVGPEFCGSGFAARSSGTPTWRAS